MKYRSRATGRGETPFPIHDPPREKPVSARHSIIAAFNFHVSNDIIKIPCGINLHLINNTNLNYMKIMD
ncbi:hypothetical protein OH687_33025 [Burkholderia anthina]|nr:hypothetical protein OH687_33025 [Burkholderia anthina]